MAEYLVLPVRVALARTEISAIQGSRDTYSYTGTVRSRRVFKYRYGSGIPIPINAVSRVLASMERCRLELRVVW